MVYLFYIAVFVVFLGGGYLFARRFLFGGRSLVVLNAQIDAIKVPRIGEIWSPELLVDYYFFYLSEKYYGSDYIRLDALLAGRDMVLADRYGFPLLMIDDREFLGEEHIEMYILENTREIPVEFQIATLPMSRIHKEKEEKKTLFQNVSIDFPWSR